MELDFEKDSTIKVLFWGSSDIPSFDVDIPYKTIPVTGGIFQNCGNDCCHIASRNC